MPRKTYNVPETRLPFINGEVTEVNFQGRPHLVSGVWGDAAAAGRIYFWDPLSKSHAMRMLPKGALGAYMLKTAADGRLYIGDGRGNLHRYDPGTDQIETLVTGQLHSITWGGCVTDRHVLWTADPGEAVLYDWRDNKILKVFKPVDTSDPHSHYGHNVLPSPDGKSILLMMDVPQSHICSLNLADQTITPHVPEAIEGQTYVLNGAFVDPATLLLITDTKVSLVSYPDFKTLKSIGYPKSLTKTYSRGSLVAGHFYSFLTSPTNTRDLYRLGPPDWTWNLVAEKWMGEDTGYIGNFQNKLVAGISINGTALTYDPATNKTTTMDVENTGVMDCHAFCVGPEANLIVGSPFINARFWTIDLQTGQGKDQGRGMPGGGQINQILWDAGRHKALMSSYTEAAVMEFDPALPTEWPRNPRIVATAKSEKQLRPWESVFDRRYVWMATSADYGVLGGALSRIDPETNQIKVWRHIVKDQTINALVLDLPRRRLYYSSQIYADGQSAPPTQTTAEIGCFDIDNLKVIRQQKFLENIPAIGVVCMLPDNTVLVHNGPDFYSWTPTTGETIPLGKIERLGSVAVDDDGTVYASFGNATGRLELKNNQLGFIPLIEGRSRQLQIAGDILYYSTGTQIHSIPLNELRQLKNATP